MSGLQFRDLSDEEKSAAFPKRGQMDLSDYIDLLKTRKVGDAIELQLDGTTQRAMKRRLGQAIKRALPGTHLKFRSCGYADKFVVFQIRAVTGARKIKPDDRRRRSATCSNCGQPILALEPQRLLDNRKRAHFICPDERAHAT